MVPIRNGESQPNDIFTVTVSKEPERYDLGGYPIGGFIDDHYDHFEVPDFHLARDGSKLTPFVASLLLNDNRVADPATFSSETRSGEFLNCEVQPEGRGESQLESLRRLLQIYSNAQRVTFDQIKN